MLTDEDKQWAWNILIMGDGFVMTKLLELRDAGNAYMEKRAVARHKGLLKAIAAIGSGGGGPTADAIADKIAERMKD